MRVRWTPEMEARLRAEYPSCQDPSALAAALGVTLRALRKRAFCLRLARSSDRLRQARGLAAMLYARESGWPEDITSVRQIQILNVLAAHGLPMTGAEIAQAMGVSYPIGSHQTQSCRWARPWWRGADALQAITRRGLVVRFKRAHRKAKNTCDLYCLSAYALDILEERRGSKESRQGQ